MGVLRCFLQNIKDACEVKMDWGINCTFPFNFAIVIQCRMKDKYLEQG